LRLFNINKPFVLLSGLIKIPLLKTNIFRFILIIIFIQFSSGTFAKENTISQNEVNIIFANVLQNFENMDSYKATNYNYVKGNFYNLQPVKEARTAISMLTIIFKKPRIMYMEIVDSKDAPKLNNTRFFYEGGKTVKIKPPGILGLFAYTFPITKPELTNNRGYTMQQVDTVTLLSRLNDKALKVKFAGFSKVFNDDVYLLELTNIKMPDPKITREIIGVRKTDNIMLLHEMYEGETLVYQDKFQNFLYNAPVTEEDFKL
jgi:hypothetical protein